MNGLPVPPKGGSPSGGTGAEPRVPDQRLGRNQRLIRSAHFDEAFAGRNKHVGRFMIMWLRSADDASLRLGVITSRKVGGAVQRVRARRLLREVFRRNRHTLTGSFDILLVARAALLKATTLELENEFLTLAAKAGLRPMT
jgi:ribonuclease P protein component